ncbi:hypothetical protein [Methylotenera sp.]|uniref:hypothetical protein n=1 Tax=Methylotenera sp. TaxID=2051956 RepID=UPI002736B014|nr:hypothetical protein [Methylotenera sp.]MDP3778010.1 hypothetical protein [Methylotenera sp.]
MPFTNVMLHEYQYIYKISQPPIPVNGYHANLMPTPQSTDVNPPDLMLAITPDDMMYPYQHLR